MKTAAIVLLIALLAPLAAAERLSNEQILSRLDEAAAAEARWILAAKVYSTGASGFAGEMTRGGTAYQVLLRANDHRIFELLTHSESDTAACYGVAGVAKLAPERLHELLPHLILRRETVLYYGSVGGPTCAAEELLRLIGQTKAPVDKSAIKAAWRALLEHLETSEAQLGDGFVVRDIQKLLGSLAIEPAPTSLAYALALADPVDGSAEGWEARADRLRVVAAGDNATSARLALQALADSISPDLETDLIEQVWARDLTLPDAAFDLRVSAEFWDRVVSGANRDPLDDSARWYNCPWHSLTERDWNWLAAIDDPQISESVARLRANPIAGWRIDLDLPQDPDARRHAVLCLLAAVAKDEGLQARRARQQLLKVLDDAPAAVSLDLVFEGGASVGRMLVKLLGTEAILSRAAKAAGSDDRATFLAGVNLIGCVLEHDEKAEGAVAALENLAPMLRRLLKECESAPTQELWPLRLTTMAVLEAARAVLKEELGDEFRAATRQRWLLELARKLVDSPRQMPPQVNLDLLTYLIYEESDISRAGALIYRVYEGDDWFVPDYDYEEPPESEHNPTPAIILRRMRDAASRLD
jgi:hypothetical protein